MSIAQRWSASRTSSIGHRVHDRQYHGSIAALFLLAKSPENRMTINPADAVRRLMRNILFFARDGELFRQVFQSAYAFTAAVLVFQLSLFPDAHVWDLIG